jgi:hypothetical protein
MAAHGSGLPFMVDPAGKPAVQKWAATVPADDLLSGVT